MLTDRAGRFVLPAEDLDFTGNEPRPDLVLGVFAPEDVTNPQFPYPAPPRAGISRDRALAEQRAVLIGD